MQCISVCFARVLVEIEQVVPIMFRALTGSVCVPYPSGRSSVRQRSTVAPHHSAASASMCRMAAIQGGSLRGHGTAEPSSLPLTPLSCCPSSCCPWASSRDNEDAPFWWQWWLGRPVSPLGAARRARSKPLTAYH